MTWAVHKAIALAWLYGGGGTAMPDAIASFDKAADAAIDKLAVRRRKNGASDYSPAPAQEINGSIALSADRVTLDSYQRAGTLITVTITDNGATERLELLANSFRDLRPVFAQFAKWLRNDVQRTFDTEGNGQWPKRKQDQPAGRTARIEANVARIEANRYRSLQGSLRSSRGKVEKTTQDHRQQTACAQTAQRRKYNAQLDEVARLAGGGETARRAQKLYDRVARRDEVAAARIQRAQEGKLLSGIAQSLRSETGSDFYRMFSRIPWAYVHNDGGTGGKGSTGAAAYVLSGHRASAQVCRDGKRLFC